MRYKHDCNKCIFLGEFSSDGQDYDLYFCNGRGTIVARYGNDGPDYSSGLILTSETLAKGLCLAIEAKLINFNRDFHVFETLSEVVCFNVGCRLDKKWYRNFDFYNNGSCFVMNEKFRMEYVMMDNVYYLKMVRENDILWFDSNDLVSAI